jgi:hypothetical protein
MAAIRDKLVLRDPESEVDKKLLRELFHAEKRALNLEKQLLQAGIAVPKDDIPYSIAKAKMAKLTEEIKVVAGGMGIVTDTKEMSRLESEYAKLSQELEKYNNALMLSKEWAADQIEKERLWEEKVRPKNQQALKKLRRHMPVDIRDMSEEELAKRQTPNGKTLPQKIARKFKRTNILLLLRMNPSAIGPTHPSSLESMRTTGLTLTERRALYEHLKELGPKWKTMTSDKMAERKWMWHASLKSKYKELVEIYQSHVDQYGPPDNHPYAKRNDPNGRGCPLLGNQCPVKADLAIDYNDDYGFPEGADYNTETVKKSNLLSWDDLERRKKESDDECRKVDSHASGKSTNFLSGISTRNDDEGRTAPARTPSGIMSAVSAISNGGETRSAVPATKPRARRGGLLAVLGSGKKS